MAWRRYCCTREVLPFSVMVLMECINVGLNTLFKAATMKGMSYHVFVVYAYAIAALLLLPAPFFSHRSVSISNYHQQWNGILIGRGNCRSTGLPPLNLKILSKIGLLGLIGYCTKLNLTVLFLHRSGIFGTSKYIINQTHYLFGIFAEKIWTFEAHTDDSYFLFLSHCFYGWFMDFN